MRLAARRRQRRSAASGSVELDRALRIRDPVAVDAAGDDLREVEALALGVVQALLEARRLGHPRQDVRQSVEAILRALDVDARVVPAAARASGCRASERTTAIGVRSSCESRLAMFSW